MLQMQLRRPVAEARDAREDREPWCRPSRAARAKALRRSPGPKRAKDATVPPRVSPREEVLTMVSHDLRGPLAAIVILTDQMLAKAAISTRETSANEEDVTALQLAAIRRAAQRMTMLVADLLDDATIRVRDLALHRAMVPIAQLVAESVDAIQPLAISRGITVEVAISSDAGAAWVDPLRVHQILWNVLGNAVKYSQRGGVIRVVADAIAAGARVLVTDNGRGIAADELPHVFEPFWQGRAARRGAGLGLHIVRSLVEAHGGTIGVASEPGVGTTVAFTLPAAPPERPRVRAAKR